MKPDQERVRNLLMDTVTLLCKNGLHYKKELRVQGLLGITLDNKDVFVVHINEKFGDLLGGAISLTADDSDADKLMMADAGGSETERRDDTAKPTRRKKRRRRSGDNSSSPLPPSPGGAPASQQILHRPIKRLMTSTPCSSSRFDKRTFHMNNSSAAVMTDGMAGDAAAAGDAGLPPPPLSLDVKVKTEDDVMIVDDEDCAEAARVPLAHGEDGYPGLSLNEIQSNYQHFEQILGLAETLSGDPGGGEPAADRHPTRDPYGQQGDIVDAKPAPGVGPDVARPFVTGIVRNETGAHDATNSTWDASQISAHNSGYAADGQSLTVNSAVAGCSSWDPSQAAAAARQAVSGTEQGADSVGYALS